MSKKTVIIWLSVIVLLGGVLRFYNLGEVSFSADEFLDMNSSYAYLQSGEWKNWDFNKSAINVENEFAPRDERAWGYKIQAATLFGFFPPTEAVARSASALWGVLTVALMYFVGTFFSGKRQVGLISAFLFAVSIVGIEFDRTFRMYAMFFPLFLLFSRSLFRFFEGRYSGKIKLLEYFSQRWGVDLRYLFPTAIFGALSLHVHQLTANMAFIFGAYALGGAVYTLAKKRPFWNKYVVSTLALLATYILGMVLFPEALRQYSAGIGFFENHYNYFAKALVDYAHPLIAILFIGVGGYCLAEKLGKRKEAAWLLASFLVTLFSAVFLWTRNVGPQYIFFVQSFEMILVAVGIYGIADFFREKLGKEFGKKAFIIPLVLSLLVLPNYAYFFEVRTTGASSPTFKRTATKGTRSSRGTSGVIIIPELVLRYMISEGSGPRIRLRLK
ncbi:MAG: hypothetical protein UW95_C0020G0010 [Parcubacteria group bacterium GW2011_GWC1_45_14]|nr:MAG: hypothetical protein UW95_C0020G0010 [Parcubacteria group bacterium GW2011_GWC1_45_14]